MVRPKTASQYEVKRSKVTKTDIEENNAQGEPQTVLGAHQGVLHGIGRRDVERTCSLRGTALSKGLTAGG